MLVLIIGTATAVKQPPYMTLPLIISVFVMLLQIDINRYAFLVGGINCVIYAIVYFIIGIYASAGQSLFFSFPLQIITFINWKKHAYKSSTILKSLSAKQRIIIALAFFLCWSAVAISLYKIGNPYAILDTTASILGVLSTFLSMFTYKEYPYISVVGGLITIFLNVQVCLNNIQQLPYLIYSVYSYICIIITTVNINKLYKEQKVI